jgi:hypothetical protein
MSRQLHVHAVPTRAEHLRTVVEIVAILAAGAWALYTFVYEQRIKPLSQRPAFATPTTIEQGPTINGAAILTIHKRLDNNGDVPIDIAASTLTVYGETLASHTELRIDASRTVPSISDDVPRHITKVLYSVAKLRAGAVDGNPNLGFLVPPHSSADEVFVVAVPVRTYPMIRMYRKDYITKAPIVHKVPVHIVRGLLGAYDLASSQSDGEYDWFQEFAIKP